jgi:hypothetical protein
MLAAALKLPPSAAHTSHSKHKTTAAAAATKAQPNRPRAIANAVKAEYSMKSGAADAELDALVQDAIVWASQHGLVSYASRSNSFLQLKRMHRYMDVETFPH